MDAGNFTEDEKVRASSAKLGLRVIPARLEMPNIKLQRFVLAEYIKASQVDTEQLVAFIKKCNLQPDWFSMQLPGGEHCSFRRCSYCFVQERV